MKETQTLRLRDFIPLIGVDIYKSRNDELREECRSEYNLQSHVDGDRMLNKKLVYAQIYSDSAELSRIERAKKLYNREMLLELYNGVMLFSLAGYGTYKLIENLIN